MGNTNGAANIPKMLGLFYPAHIHICFNELPSE